MIPEKRALPRTFNLVVLPTMLRDVTAERSTEIFPFLVSGPITMGDVIQAMPWSNSVDVVR